MNTILCKQGRHRSANITQQYLKETFGRHFIRKNKRSSSSPDWNPLDHYFRDAVKRKVYEGRQERFTSLAELKKRIRKVWNDAFDIATLRKAILEFRPRLQAVVTEHVGPTKVHFGSLYALNLHSLSYSILEL